MKYFILVFALSFSNSFSQVRKNYTLTEYKDQFDSLYTLYGHNKILPKGFELATLVALSHYPELKDSYITFVLKETYIPLVSRPKYSSVFKKKKNWEYLVIISNHSNEEMESILLKSLSFNAQVGIIGHELGHTQYYLDKSFGDMMGVAFHYIDKKYRAHFEKDTDKRAIDHGLGWQLYDYAIYSRALPNMTDENIEWINQFYMNGESVLNYMRIHPLYKDDIPF